MATTARDLRGAEASLATVDRLARLQLEARRQGCRLALVDVPRELRELVTFCGLDEAFDELRREAEGD